MCKYAAFLLKNSSSQRNISAVNACTLVKSNSIDHGDYSPEDAAANAARLFLSYINSTSTITGSYALAIILGTSLVMLAMTGLAYLVASAIFTGMCNYATLFG